METARPALVGCDPEVLSGTPVFVGSRLPVQTLLASVEAGVPWNRLVESWPWLTLAHLDAARDWVARHPEIGIRPWLVKTSHGG